MNEAQLNRATWVYRCYCEHRSLLYVGVARDIDRRLAQHAATKPWWTDVDEVLGDLYQTRRAALRVEAHCIKYDRPQHNIAGQSPRPNDPLIFVRRKDFGRVGKRLVVELQDTRDINLHLVGDRVQ